MTTAILAPVFGAAAAPADDAALPDSLFVTTLVRLIRAHDRYGVWDGKPDAALLAGYLVTSEQRRQIPIVGDPDPDTVDRLELFYAAVGLAVEQRTGIVAAPMFKLSHEGWGRMILTAGRLVVLSRSLREVHRFGFPSLARLAGEGERLVAEAVAAIERFPDVARA